ncbi:WD repeat-containing protein 74 [Cucumis melo var. makuwa]|uniref:WD repeat-containing protein 74 n=2 Tax=Cucumis melo TaxID=3656 RepID=A0A5D3BIZ1_CUCMM|nr:WD-repeat protein [Cucumis melo subsp. melo]TYJ99243.1 WD repeat-containing protein 74 [Cucumis melo var. makuwa]
MPRTTTLDCPGCPPLRALTFDVLGLVKVIEARGKEGEIPKVVERWGEPDFSKSVLAASLADRKFDPLLAVARKNGLIEVLNPLNGNLHVAISDNTDTSPPPKDEAIVGMHLFSKDELEVESRRCTLLSCTTKGNASMRSIEFSSSSSRDASTNLVKTWKVCGSGDVMCSKVDGSETHALFGGKGVEVNMWNLEQCTKIWTAKAPKKNNLGIFTPTWFTSATFLSKDDHRKFAAGTNSHQVRLYDISAQKRPVISFDFRETPIKSLAEDVDGNTIFVGNASGDLASFDIRNGKLLGCFLGKCSGSIRSIARHPELPVIASCGLDSYVRFWDINTRQLLSAVFLKQHLTGVVFDSHFVGEDVTQTAVELIQQETEAAQTVSEEEHVPRKRKKSSKEDGEGRKRKGSKTTNKESKKKQKEVTWRS